MKENDHGKKKNILAVIGIFILLLALIPAASAFTATLVSSTTAYPGDTVTISINGIVAGDALTTELISTNLATNGGTVMLNNFNMPFGYATGTATSSLTTTGIPATTTLSVTQADSTTYTKTGSGSPNTISSTKDITKQVFPSIAISGSPSGSTVGIDYTVGGSSIVAGYDDPATLSFALNGVNTGNLQILVKQGSTVKLDTTVNIVARPVTPSNGGDNGGGGGSSGGSSSGPAAGPVAALGPVVAPQTGPATTTVEFQQNPEGQVLATYALQSDPEASVGSTVTVSTGTKVTSPTGQIVTGISITPIDIADVPAATGGVYSFSGYSLECAPSGTQFSQPATIEFSLTPDQWTDALARAGGNPEAMTIQYYDATAGAWVEVPTVVDPITHHVSASITHFSMYALFYKNPSLAAASSATSIVYQMTPTVESSTTYAALVANTPVSTPVPQPTPTKSSMMPGIVIIGLIGLVGYFVAQKKH